MSGNGQHDAGHHPSGHIALGFGGLQASVGDHIGHFYQTREEWKAILIPFLKAGLEAGDTCAYLMSPASRWHELHAELAAAQIDVDAALASGLLVLDEGKTSPEELRRWFTRVSAEPSGRPRLLRWGGDMTWSLQHLPTSTMLMEWETMCNLMDTPAVFLCQYELTQFAGSVVIDALKTHPLCIMGSVMHQNPFYMKPEAFLAELRRRPLG